ncbi:hypothetical protein HRW16_23605 [Streptomyces lunaelactis]|uniref:hypothetical protein n=1 Tax=Streptomyces lunaelactis TaxID=1535768 RepID=UPI001584D57D|nr:hypothetical protein [Streptomyces lunaelactis]NUK32508.1 hypothetical protein [Streptomyces lunaelactis]NUK94765.1 hypothetical protein [Streptomyces lunaelactis]NUL30183.1 hypothetical protein [Streptomyces lunaelactis]
MTRQPPGPTPGTLAPHIPADVYRQAEREGRPIIIVHQTPQAARPPRSYLVPLGIALAAAIGVAGTVAAILALFEFAAHAATLVAGAAGPIGLGITLRLVRPKK